MGPKSEAWLHSVDINSLTQLKEIGAVAAYYRLTYLNNVPENLNLLYALEGAISDRSWQDVAKHDKSRLLMELEGYKQLQQQFTVID